MHDDENTEMHLDIDIAVGEEGYGRTGNPVYVWFALRAALAKGGPLPAWISAYLAEVASSIMREAQYPPTRVAPALQRCLFGEPNEEGGKGSPFSKFKDDFVRQYVGAQVDYELGEVEGPGGPVAPPAADADEAVRRVEKYLAPAVGSIIARRRIKERYNAWKEFVESAPQGEDKG